MKYDLKNICPQDECTGCLACYNACPVKAIDISFDKLGFAYPEINGSCIDCGKCSRICPINSGFELNHPKKCFAGYVKDGLRGKYVTSGGIATGICEDFLLRKGVIYGVSYDRLIKRFVFKRVTDIIDLQLISGSKYVQADVGHIYQSVKTDLTKGLQVVFIGTPCQVEGLKKFLSSDYDNLLTVDIICHGVPSQKMLFECLDVKERDPIRIQFREGDKYKLACFTEDGNKYFADDVLYYEAFSSGRSLRVNCHNCRYATINRCSDLTIGDFWGISVSSAFAKKQFSGGGVSVILVNSEKGLEYFRSLKPILETEERPVEEAQNGNTQLRKPVADNKSAKKFRKLYGKTSLKKSVIKSRTLVQHISHIKIVKKLYKKIFR